MLWISYYNIRFVVDYWSINAAEVKFRQFSKKLLLDCRYTLALCDLIDEEGPAQKPPNFKIRANRGISEGFFSRVAT